VEAKIEAWLKMLLEAMRDSLKYIFYKFYTDVMATTKKLPERDKLRKTI
jgi:hypothetical protein